MKNMFKTKENNVKYLYEKQIIFNFNRFHVNFVRK